MSIATDLTSMATRLNAALTGSNTAITGKGGTAASDITGLAAAIGTIPTGGTPTLQTKTVTFEYGNAGLYVTPDAGYDGLAQVNINGDSDCVAGNIKSGVEIFGVTGTYAGGGALVLDNDSSANLSYIRSPKFLRVALPETFEISLPYCSDLSMMFGNKSSYLDTCFGAKHITVHGSQAGQVMLMESMFGRATETGGFWGSQKCALETITLDFDMSNVTNYAGFFMSDKRDLLQAIYGTFDFSSVTTDANAAGFAISMASLTYMRFAANTLSVNLSLAGASALDSASLISLANCLVAGGAKTITLHATAKANCNGIYVLNDNGTAVLSSSGATGAITLTSYITTVKGWTIA